MAWTELPFGKHRGKTLPQVAFADPDWIYWAAETKLFTSPKLAAELADVARKGRRIKIPDNDAETQRVRYYIDPIVGKVANVEVIDAHQGPHVGSSRTRETQLFDLSMPRQISPYDKTGGKFVVTAIKYNVFGSSKTRLTTTKCDDFFNDASNFG